MATPACSSASANLPWPAGALLPADLRNTLNTAGFTHWALRTIRYAKVEFAAVVDSMIDDLEGLNPRACTGGGMRCLPMPRDVLGSPSDNESAFPIEDDEGSKVSDLRAPSPERGEYELELPDHAEPEEGFEIIDFEEEARIIALY
mmetsp:Transcript_44095/g.73192  ORF Transcript_44095/g.73192 Transcript_44095/m.73192 type:complete len:146 (+) Transcript_44095:61-498(+)|eukprot:CAMPEP_0119326460 /NCGR_PEP_ID=MMETSP1333-20130426/68463_1 /TAXON_ID=418940 /ORGANISM="Scyphosphaera apsteinii, Strain RCC1455" /LENGTH=145 /DNA_ID=CAMNT_0007334775 /DNA_START=63 /DNA_END=500 /DNA_ORIENTATION=+